MKHVTNLRHAFFSILNKKRTCHLNSGIQLLAGLPELVGHVLSVSKNGEALEFFSDVWKAYVEGQGCARVHEALEELRIHLSQSADMFKDSAVDQDCAEGVGYVLQTLAQEQEQVDQETKRFGRTKVMEEMTQVELQERTDCTR